MSRLNKQQVLDKVVDHFIINKGPFSMAPPTIGGCAYRLDDGKKKKGSVKRCAVGILIPKSIWESQLKLYKNFSGVLEVWPSIQDLFAPDVTPTFLKDVQNAHDWSALPLRRNEITEEAARKKMYRSLGITAAKYRLTIKAI